MIPTTIAHRRTAGVAARLACAFLTSLAAGCASMQQPPAAAPVAELDVADIQRAPPAEPATVRWGGTIARVTNTDAETTTLEVVARPLAASGRPRHVDRSPGRFLAEVDAFLDPEIVREGRDVTVTGTVGALRDGKVGEADYRFPVVAVENWRYWRPAARVPVGYGPYGPYGPHPPYGPYGYAYDPFDFHQRFWHDFWHDPLFPDRHRHPRGGRVGVGVTVRP